MARRETDDVREEMGRLQAENRLEAQNKLVSLQNQPKDFGLGTFVSEMILLDTISDESGTISPDLLQFEHKKFPRLPKPEKLDGGRVITTADTNPGLAALKEKDPSVFDALPREEKEKPKKPSLPSNIEEYKFPALEEFNVAELIELLKRVKARLPATKLKDLDLEEELVLHFLDLKELMTVVLYDDDTPANQKAQIANTCASLLQQMTKSQATLYSAERVKRMEVALLKSLHGMPQDILEDFLERYEKIYSAEEM